MHDEKISNFQMKIGSALLLMPSASDSEVSLRGSITYFSVTSHSGTNVVSSKLVLTTPFHISSLFLNALALISSSLLSGKPISPTTMKAV